jgi:hypothetical protein
MGIETDCSSYRDLLGRRKHFLAFFNNLDYYPARFYPLLGDSWKERRSVGMFEGSLSPWKVQKAVAKAPKFVTSPQRSGDQDTELSKRESRVERS